MDRNILYQSYPCVNFTAIQDVTKLVSLVVMPLSCIQKILCSNLSQNRAILTEDFTALISSCRNGCILPQMTPWHLVSGSLFIWDKTPCSLVEVNCGGAQHQLGTAYPTSLNDVGHIFREADRAPSQSHKQGGWPLPKQVMETSHLLRKGAQKASPIDFPGSGTKTRLLCH